MAGYPGKAVVTGPISLSDPSDVYETHWAELGKGGHASVASIVARNAIFPKRREFGMTRTVVSDANPANNKTYMLANLAMGGVDNDVNNNSNWIVAVSATGTVTSVGLSLPSIFSVTGSPVTGAGTLAATLANQVQKTFWAGPVSGADTTPVFRTIQTGDLPDLSSTYLARAGGQMVGQLTLSADPTLALHAATKSYVDALVTGLSWKSPAAACATTANISLSGEQTIDGVLTSSSRILVKDQTTKSQNGIYVTAGGAWTRATDADNADEMTSATILVIGGSTQANTQWTCITKNIVLGSTDLVFTQIGANVYAYAAGAGLALSANTFSIPADGVSTNMIGNAVVTKAKFENITAQRLLGRYDGSDGVMQHITIGNGIALNTGTGLLGLGISANTTIQSNGGNFSLTIGDTAGGKEVSQLFVNLTKPVGHVSSNNFIVSTSAGLQFNYGDHGQLRFQSSGGLTIQQNSADTNTALQMLTITRNTSGTAANGIGAYLSLTVEDATGALKSALLQHELVSASAPFQSRVKIRAYSPTGGNAATFLQLGEISYISNTQGLAISGGSPDGYDETVQSSSILDLRSVTKTLLLPRIINEANVTTPANGMIYYNTTSHQFRARKNGAWVDISGGGSTLTSGNAITINGSAIDSGGPMTGHVTITNGGGSYTYSIGTSASKITHYSQYSSLSSRMLVDVDSGDPTNNTKHGLYVSADGLTAIGGVLASSGAITKANIKVFNETTESIDMNALNCINVNTGGMRLMGSAPVDYTPQASSLLELNSTTKTLLMSRIATEGNVTTPVNGMVYYNSTLNKFRGYQNGAWTDVIGLVTNTAANNEIMKSNGTGATASGLFSSSTGDLVLGSTSIAGHRKISASSSDASSSLVLAPKGSSGYVTIGFTGGYLLLGETTDGINNRYILAQGSSTDLNIGLFAKGAGSAYMQANTTSFLGITAGYTYLNITHGASVATLQTGAQSTSSDGDHLAIRGGDTGPSGLLGGNLILSGGAFYGGGGRYGYILMDNLPTSSVGLPSKAIWNNAGVLSIAP